MVLQRGAVFDSSSSCVTQLFTHYPYTIPTLAEHLPYTCSTPAELIVT
jgi:hypothetical protein